MPTYLTPGVYFEKPQVRAQASAQRTDVAGFVGLAERGPLHEPQRLTTWREFQQVFGGFLPYAYLAYAVRAFFENGGRTCYVVRVADQDTAHPASVKIPEQSDTPESASPLYTGRAIDEGTWGDRLAISIQSAVLGASHHEVIATLPDDRLAVAAITGFETGSRVRLSQETGGAAVQVIRRVNQVDPILGVLTFEESLKGSGLVPSDTQNPISLESLEFTLLVWQEDQVAERFADLAPDPSHSRYAVDRVNGGSRLIRLNPASDSHGLPELPWRGQLGGGANGLRKLSIYDYVGTPQGALFGLAALAKIDEVGILAIPDLTIHPRQPALLQRRPRRRIDECALGTPVERFDLTGRVVDSETGLPLTGAKVSDGLQDAKTDLGGRFTLTNLLPGNVDLVISAEDYMELTSRVTLRATGPTIQDQGDIRLAPIDLPPILKHVDIAYGQQVMIAQCETLRDRFALIDPPLTSLGDVLDTSDILAWRARFDTHFAALYYPWLIVRDPLTPGAVQGRLAPPSGHVAGIYAATDLSAGVFRPPANQTLAFVDDVAASVDDALQGLLNPRGINVIRPFPGRGIRVYGARTMSSDSAWRYVNVRRLMSMLEESLHDSLQWAVFEPNDDQLRLGLRLSITGLLDGLWRRGAFLGDKPEAAYQVRCDAITTPPEVQAKGQVIAEVSVAPTVPYEFIVLRLGLTADELRISEV